MTIETFLARFGRPTPTGGQWLVRCPGHDDRKASLAVKEGDDGCIVLHCHAGCDTSRILRAMGLRTADLFPSRDGPTAQAGTIDTTYDYTDENRALLFQVVRYTPKGFRQRRPDGAGGWIWTLNGTRRVVYRLPDLKGREDVLIVEGEKDVDCAWAHGLPATCNAGGASGSLDKSKWRQEYTQQLVMAGLKRIVIVPDNDDPGHAHAAHVARSCHAAGLKVRIVSLPEVPEKGDLSDYFGRHTTADFLALVKATAFYEPTAAPDMPHVQSTFRVARPVLVRMADVQPEDVSWIWPMRVARRKLNLIVGDPGLGKSTIALDAAARVTRGAAWPDGGLAPLGDVVILTAEDGLADTVRPRLDLLGADVTRVHVLRAVREATGVERSVSLVTDVGPLEQAIAQTRAVLVIIDPVSAYLGMANSYRDSEVRAILAPLHALAERTGAAIWGVMHLTKDQQRQAVYRGQGSIAFVGAARLMLAVGADPADENRERRFLMPVKSNVCAPASTLAYRIISNDERGRLTWEPTAVTNVDVNAVLASQRPQDADERRDAEVFLREQLADGPTLSTDILKAAEAQGISRRTLFRAKGRLGVEAEHLGGFASKGKWYWRLPDAVSSKSATRDSRPAKSAISGDVALLGENPAKSADFIGARAKSATGQEIAPLGGDRARLALLAGERLGDSTTATPPTPPETDPAMSHRGRVADASSEAFDL
jgi:hypothetical protein